MRAISTALVCLFCLIAAAPAAAQENDEPLLADLSDEFSFEDSLSIFLLIDSLVNMTEPSSQLSLRLGYNSNVLSAGRTLGIEQFGLAPGVSYYHKSGAYADVTTYWSKDFDPNLYLTTLSAGYLHLFSPKFSVIGGYEYYWYHGLEDNYLPYRHALNVSPFFETKALTLRLDYTFYFGDDFANRIMPGISGNLVKRNFLGFNRISFYPSVYVLFGDESLTEIEFTKPETIREALENIARYGTRFGVTYTERRVFGLMNYAFSFPLNMSVDRWLFNITYTYSVPKALEGEPLLLEESGFISASIVYTLDL